MKVRIADIVEETTVDGPGLRTSIYFQGCNIKCKGCHNPHLQDENGGREVEIQDIVDALKADPYIDGISILGGEPFLQPVPLRELVRQVRLQCPHLSIWVYSGHTLDKLKYFKQILKDIDCLVDGPYIESLKTDEPFIGSSNQKKRTKEELRKLCKLWI